MHNTKWEVYNFSELNACQRYPLYYIALSLSHSHVFNVTLSCALKKTEGTGEKVTLYSITSIDVNNVILHYV